EGATQLLRWTPHTTSGAWVTVGQPTATTAQLGAVSAVATGVRDAVSFPGVTEMLASPVAADPTVATIAGGDRFLPMAQPPSTPISGLHFLVPGAGFYRKREVNGPFVLNLSRVPVGTDLSDRLQDAMLAAVSAQGTGRYGGELHVLAPPGANYTLTKQIVIPARLVARYLGGGIESDNLEAGNTAFLVQPTDGSTSLFRFDTASVPTFGYTRTGSLLGFSAKLAQAARGQGYMYVDLKDAAYVDVGGETNRIYVEGFDTLYRLDNSMGTTVRNIVCRAFVTGMRATGGAARVSTTHVEQAVTYKGETICDRARHLAADSVYDLVTRDVVYESLRWIGDIERGNRLTEDNPYAENIPCDGAARPWYNLFVAGVSAHHANAQGYYEARGGVMAGYNTGPVHDDGVGFNVGSGECHLFTDIRRVQAPVQSAASTTLLVLDHRPEQTGTANQPDEYRRIADWTVVRGSVRRNVIGGVGLATQQTAVQRLRGYGRGHEVRPVYQTHENDYEMVALTPGGTQGIWFLNGLRNLMTFAGPVGLARTTRAALPPPYLLGTVQLVSNPEAGKLALVMVGAAGGSNQWQYLDGTAVALT
ncbi:hypothetical protein K7W42_22585, partial [Deinococcus sp. HMF7604]|uniref:hypothetical protein n=1 Tax=Deinococcus betulae TaxID=2873312 RepID=UPI001CCE629D